MDTLFIAGVGMTPFGRMISVDIKSLVRQTTDAALGRGRCMTRRPAALAMMRNAPQADGDERGVIVNVPSGAAFQSQIGQAAYSASKAGVIGLTLSVARDLPEHAIRVVTIAPGLFDTAMVAGMPPKVSQSIIDRMVLYPPRMGRPEEFAKLIRHVIENAYLNATTISLDAGARITAR
jgi:NAD(P)-dependent dehydrogenase (short-subunit alcohol dehydrogenase family)